MSVDLKNIRPEFEEILLNKRIIEVNQDALGIYGLRVKQDQSIEVHFGCVYTFFWIKTYLIRRHIGYYF